MSDKRSSGGFFAGLIFGGIAGAIAGILWAPRSGNENRDLLMERFPELKERAPELINRATDEVKSRLDAGRQAFHLGAAETRQRMEGELDQARREGDAA
jgi:gas vesicle protein